MEFRLLGTVSVVTEAGGLPLGPVKRRSLLAALLLRPNNPVLVEQLTAALWEQESPPSARSVIQGHVSRLRTSLISADAGAYGVELITQGTAYVLRMPEARLDAHRFQELVSLARGQRGPAEALAMYREALSLWQGPALADAYPSPPLQAAAHALEELRLGSVEQMAALYGQLGEHAQAAAVLHAEAVAHPLRESLSAALMTALHKAGRRSEALDWFHRTRRLLADELGIGPGRELGYAYAVVLREEADDTAVDAAALSRAATVHVAPLPSITPIALHPGVADLLPRAPRGFHGRAQELVALSRAAEGEAPVCLVTGPAGVGKTALVVQWAHRERAGFPGGRLYADLRGFGDTGEPTIAEVLREFLLALGVAPRRMPESANGAAALFRSLAADRELLVVLDNARESEQVRPLLPGGPRCVTVVTSRYRLPGLIVTDAARPVPVDVLTTEDGTALLAGVLGEERVLAEPMAARQLAELCGGLPLALRVAAARLADRPDWALCEMNAEMLDSTHRLSLLEVEDTGIRAALRLTVRQLPEHVADHFACLGRHPGTRFDRYATAALVQTDLADAEATLERLVASHLVTEAAPGRWTLHDLVRLYARGLDARPDTLTRVLDHYIVTALAAATAAEPGNETCVPLPPDFLAPTAVRRFTDRNDAMAWYTAERDNLVLAAAAARTAGLHSRTWRIVMLLWPLMARWALDDWTPLLETALDAARADADPAAESRVRALLGWVLTEEGRSDEALRCLEMAPALSARAGDLRGEASALVVLSWAQAALGDPDEAAGGCARAVELAREADDRYTERLALYHLARYRLDTGQWQSALDTATEALAFEDLPGTVVASRVLLLTTAGEALLGLGDETEGLRRLGVAAREAETSGYDDGAVRALGVLLRVSEDAGFRARYDAAVARLTADVNARL
ncbi:BTAD domain-containing putative transcriptional regulator [Streptomyces sp. H27-H1]|uniref:AfsR/SARP family transcriptional regulator n=1 Tax=Streptomyces sp. H27-H1 TaxID=2996461 RepID=UPI002271D372|nr:BTAD domain-containing putative transcriptional regulator [Streptomyces sp. H27-H1]MCY0932517.1 BTAD domain-containing putative transcriptional regulator [Streptomyces sp. H27-H1]